MRGFLQFFGWFFIVLILLMILSGIRRLVYPSPDDYSSANIAVIEIEGVITDSLPVLKQIEKVKDNEQLKAVIVRVNSPGGAVGASQEIFMELKRLRQSRPVIVSMADVAASGGLYVSLGGDVVLALPGTLTGSMGVLLQLTGFYKLLEKIYIDPVTIRSGVLKDAGNPTKPLDPQAKAYFQSMIEQTFQIFKNDVQTERKLSQEALKTLSDGRVVIGEEAVRLGLVDKIGTFHDAIDVAREKAKIEGKTSLAYLSRKPKDIWSRLLENTMTGIGRWVSQQSSPLHYRLKGF